MTTDHEHHRLLRDKTHQHGMTLCSACTACCGDVSPRQIEILLTRLRNELHRRRKTKNKIGPCSAALLRMLDGVVPIEIDGLEKVYGDSEGEGGVSEAGERGNGAV